MSSVMLVTYQRDMISGTRALRWTRHCSGVTRRDGLVVVNRWDEKAGLRTGCCTLPSYRRARSTRDKGDRPMKKVSTVAADQSSNFSQPQLTICVDLGDRSSWYCVLDPRGELQWERKVSTTATAMREAFQRMPRSRIALETGTHSPWVSRLLSELGHEVIVAHARNVRLIGESRGKDDRLEAQSLARLARMDPHLPGPVR